MIDRICISINNKCNLACRYCHFHEKAQSIREASMDVFKILDNVKAYIKKYRVKPFKIGFVGNGEPLLSFNELKSYIEYISNELRSGDISAYTITNGTIITEEMLAFFKEHNVNVGFSIDGPKSIHDKWRCHSLEKTLAGIELHKKVYGKYPSMNCTVGNDVIEQANSVISFFEKFQARITFSRMIGENGVSMSSFKSFITKAREKLNIRFGGYDCTMYGGMCGAGINNFFYANGKIYICGNCIDVGKSLSYDTPIDMISFDINEFDRTNCYKESFIK